MRRPHRKSRTGCGECRKRRVKCDERKPSCYYCTRYSIPCVYISTGLTPVPTDATSFSLSTARLGSPVPSDALHLDIKWNDLELLHHYTTSTFATLARGNKDHEKVWQVGVPQIGMEHPFLMHFILAISALHLAYQQPERQQELEIRAANHQSLALPIFRSNASKTSRENCNAIFASSVLVVVYAMALSQSSRRPLFPSPGGPMEKPAWAGLLDGAYRLLSSIRDWVADGPMKLLLAGDTAASSCHSDLDEEHFTALLPLLSSPEEPSPERRMEAQIYVNYLKELRKGFWLPYFTDGTFGRTGAEIPSQTSELHEFMKLLSNRRPEAIVVFAYQCKSLSRLGPCWFIDRYVQSRISTLKENVDDAWRPWIEWPAEKMKSTVVENEE